MKKRYYIFIIIMILNIAVFLMLLKDNNKSKENEMLITSIPGESNSFELNQKIYPDNRIEFEQFIKNTNIEPESIYAELYSYVKKNYEENEYKNVEFITETFEHNKKSFSCEIKITFLDNTNKKIKLYIPNYQEKSFELNPITEE